MAIVEQLKKARPDILLSTDIIVGFPGEREEDFQATLRIMREVGFASSFSFVYSDRPRARAVLLPDKVERKLALERLSRLQEWQNNANDKVLASMKGEECVILLEGKSRLDAHLPEDAGSPGAARISPPGRQAPEGSVAARRNGGESAPFESWQGKTPQGFIVNVELPAHPGPERAGWRGAMLPVRIDGIARHSLKGRQAGAPW
jgi:tRNA-2-methylthio-N6-dimethylallyladenosine synthase